MSTWQNVFDEAFLQNGNFRELFDCTAGLSLTWIGLFLDSQLESDRSLNYTISRT
jgi:hypothetical protein